MKDKKISIKIDHHWDETEDIESLEEMRTTIVIKTLNAPEIATAVLAAASSEWIDLEIKYADTKNE